MTRAAPDQLASYLARIGLSAAPRADLETLSIIHRAHVEAIAWECIDCFIGRRTGRDPQAAFDKIVTQRRGGWCYEMNGLLAWMLEAIGFSVTRLAAAVMRDGLGDDAIGNHLMLIVHLDQDYIADVGLGSGLIEPIPLVAGSYRQRHAEFRLEPIEGGWWRFHNQANVLPPSFDFAPHIRDEELLESRCQWLQTDPFSPFRKTAVVQRYGPGGLETLVGRELSRIGADAREPIALATLADLEGALRDRFDLAPSDAAAIWAGLDQEQPA